MIVLMVGVGCMYEMILYFERKKKVMKKVGSVMKQLGDFNIGLMIIVMIENKMWWKNRDGKVLVKVGDLVWVCG